MPAVLPPARFHGVRHHMPAHGVLAQQGSRQRGGRSLPTRLVPYPIHFLYGHRLASPAKAVSFLYVVRVDGMGSSAGVFADARVCPSLHQIVCTMR